MKLYGLLAKLRRVGRAVPGHGSVGWETTERLSTVPGRVHFREEAHGAGGVRGRANESNGRRVHRSRRALLRDGERSRSDLPARLGARDVAAGGERAGLDGEALLGTGRAVVEHGHLAPEHIVQREPHHPMWG